MRTAILAITLVLLAAATTRAQSASAEAEALFDQGLALLDAGQIAEACSAFEGSQQRAPAIATVMNLGACREKNGQLASAWGAYIDAEGQTRGSSNPTMKTLHRVAQDHVTKLAPRLSKVTIHVAAAARIPGLVIARNTTPVDPAAWNRTLPVDGGRYTITARAPGYAPWTTTFELARERDAKSIEIPVLQRTSAVVVPKRSRTLSLAFGGGAVALFAASLGTELSARSAYDDYRLERRDSQLESANQRRLAAAGLGIAGLACAGIAVWTYLRPATAEHSRGVAITPLLAGDRAGLQVSARY